MYQLLATDIDDTLIDEAHRLPDANRELLARLHDAGVKIVFSSGRADVSIQQVASPILVPADDEYYIAFNGARVVTAASRTVVADLSVSAQSLEAVVRYAREHGLYLQGYDGDSFLVEYECPDTHAYAESTGMEFRVVDDLISALPTGSPKLLCIGDREKLEGHRIAIAEASDCSALFSKTRYLEIVRPDVDKGSALVALAARLRIPIGQTIAVGDSTNDVAMLRAAGLGLAVGNAREEAKAAADVTLSSSASDGVLTEIVEKYFPEL
jgi:Cof subfamily protein (haloacid dehalogenase superfamily)